MNGAIYALRLKLSDFINDPLEHLVVDKIHEIYKYKLLNFSCGMMKKI